MARPPSGGKRADVIAYAWCQYHGGRITWAELARTLREFRRR